MQKALIYAAEVPLKTARKAAEAFALAEKTAPLCGPAVASDMNCAMHLLRAAAQCAAENVRINLGGIKDAGEVSRLEQALAETLRPFQSAAAA
jgi:formiminotetrahydrofolate cyclodeaminase